MLVGVPALVACLQLAALPSAARTTYAASQLVRSGCPTASTAICRLSGVDEYNSLMERTRAKGRVAIVEFSTDNCVACNAMAPKISNLQKKWPSVEFAEIRLEVAGKDFFKVEPVATCLLTADC